ncbi:MAG: DUF6283 family protein [Acidimicrobiales bacterium]
MAEFAVPNHQHGGPARGDGRSGVAYQRRPCSDCPWRRDAPLGHFPPERYAALRATTGAPGTEAPIGAPMFACHQTIEGREAACAGWLATAGYWHIGVRLAVAGGRLPVLALVPQEDWPELYSSYEEMVGAQGPG